MDLKTFIALLIGILTGAIIGCYFICNDPSKCGTDSFCCPAGSEKLCEFLNTPVEITDPVNTSDPVAAFTSFKNYSRPMPRTPESPIDTFGFSIDTTIVKYLVQQIKDQGPNLKGFRFYPGMKRNGDKEVIIVNLNNTGNEIGGIIGIIAVPTTSFGSRGPCPKWCDYSVNGGRIIQ
ncbi:MAG: hypothetical protein M3Q56_08885 [Bacteroidota bacterium]|nr:hypothetical protein [Bacteroidota bacterium]